ncbi:MAG TPA: hypothetical protein VFQ91_21475 [Bryobacteraceae bacterium]|nr:hypothetical protein [Bryobacteraceae bacterium]
MSKEMPRPLQILLLLAAQCAGIAQFAQVRNAERVELPEIIDGNTSAMWADGELHIFHSSGVPTRSKGSDQFQLTNTEEIQFDSPDHKPVWFEAVWRDEDGTLYLWYHHEPGGVCADNDLTAPKIGAAISYDNGKTVHDLGIVLETGSPLHCDAENGFFAGGHGDFSVIPDHEHKFFYFLFTNYNGDVSEQGVATARLAFADRANPAGNVYKYYNGEWNEPGLGGHMTPIFPAGISWQYAEANSMWGPSIHWNSFLNTYVVLMNHVCCTSGWPQVGIYIAFSDNLEDPLSWTHPELVLDTRPIQLGPAYYPQVLGLQPGETDSLAGEVARLYVKGVSQWEIVFSKQAPEIDPPELCAEAAAPYCREPE